MNYLHFPKNLNTKLFAECRGQVFSHSNFPPLISFISFKGMSNVNTCRQLYSFVPLPIKPSVQLFPIGVYTVIEQKGVVKIKILFKLVLHWHFIFYHLKTNLSFLCPVLNLSDKINYQDQSAITRKNIAAWIFTSFLETVFVAHVVFVVVSKARRC